MTSPNSRLIPLIRGAGFLFAAASLVAAAAAVAGAVRGGRHRDEGPQHKVTLTQGFWLGESPVTQAQWNAILALA